MKKRFLLPLVAVGALTGLVAIVHASISADINACNNNNKDACLDLVRVHGTSLSRVDEITNPAYKEALKPILDSEAKAKAEQQKREAEAADHAWGWGESWAQKGDRLVREGKYKDAYAAYISRCEDSSGSHSTRMAACGAAYDFRTEAKRQGLDTSHW